MCREVYDIISPGFKGRCTAPLLIDTKAKKAVCNESSIIVRNLANLALPLEQPAAAAARGGGSAGAAVGAVDLCPAELLGDIERWNTKIYETGVVMVQAGSASILLASPSHICHESMPCCGSPAQ